MAYRQFYKSYYIEDTKNGFLVYDLVDGAWVEIAKFKTEKQAEKFIDGRDDVSEYEV